MILVFSAPGVKFPSNLRRIEDVASWVSKEVPSSSLPSWVGLPDDSEKILKIEAAKKIVNKLNSLRLNEV
jgi:hypothetical protein